MGEREAEIRARVDAAREGRHAAGGSGLGYADVVYLLAHVASLEEALRTGDDVLSRWLAHYPEDVFLPISSEQMKLATDAVASVGVTSDALHAAWARHLLHHVMQEIVDERTAVLSGLPVTERSET